jgi:hypothetical protein
MSEVIAVPLPEPTSSNAGDVAVPLTAACPRTCRGLPADDGNEMADEIADAVIVVAYTLRIFE